MSYHILPPRDPSHTVVVGWDDPLETFWVQVWQEPRYDDDDALVWRGFYPGDVAEVEQVAALVAPYADVPAGLLGVLYGDRDEGR